MDWIILSVAGAFEIVWAAGLKFTEGFTRLWPSLGTVVAMKTIPVGTGYAVWTGIGAAGTAIVGMILFDESRNVIRIICIGLIIAGILGLKFSSES